MLNDLIQKIDQVATLNAQVLNDELIQELFLLEQEIEGDIKTFEEQFLIKVSAQEQQEFNALKLRFLELTDFPEY